MVYSGPTEPQTGVLDEAAMASARGRQQAGRGRQRTPKVDDLGMSARAGAGVPGDPAPDAPIPAGPDPRRLATNRGEEQKENVPVTAPDEPGRNDPCPCGSGKKYKKCHGRV
jgi:hypothetical protein